MILILKRADIINRLAQKGYTKRDSETVIDDVFSVITEALANGESVQVFGFGTFKVKERAPRDTVDFNRDKITIPSYKAPKFTAGEFLKRAVKEGYVRK